MTTPEAPSQITISVKGPKHQGPQTVATMLRVLLAEFLPSTKIEQVNSEGLELQAELMRIDLVEMRMMNDLDDFFHDRGIVLHIESEEISPQGDQPS